MRLKRLELQGFKSFLDRTVLTFEPGITGVVGPNGCGKSNIVDAIQWVMGEQSAKHLRGDTMTDVIFNGSDSRAPTSMAEVTLVLDRTGVALSPTFASFDKHDEIAVTRRVYRDGTGEYLINRTICRLKDIHELFMDTGVGRRAYSIIEQGQIDRMINSKPEERRLIFEEVAGITKYKAKRKEAEKKLEGTRQNLLRLQDIVTELEKQIRSLKIQATRARKYKEIKGELETIDLHIIGRSLYTHDKTIRELAERKEQLSNARAEAEAELGRTDAELTSREIERVDQEKGIQQMSDRERELSLLVQRLESQMALYDERRKNLTEAIEEGAREAEALTAKLGELQDKATDAGRERDELETTVQELAKRLEDRETRLKSQETDRKEAVAKKESLQETRIQGQQAIHGWQNQKALGEQRGQEIRGARDEAEGRLSESRAQLETHRGLVTELGAKVEGCLGRAVMAEQEVVKVSAEVEDISKRLSEKEDELFRDREKFHSRRSRRESLQELQTNLEGYSATARELTLKLDETGVRAVPLAEVLQPEADIEDGLEALLGADMNALLVQTTEEAERLARFVRDRDWERVRIVALSELTSPAGVSPVEGISLAAKVRVVPGYEAAAQWWLGSSYLVPDTEALFRLRTQHAGATFVTPDTKTIGHADRAITSGATPTKMGVFARKRELEELESECRLLENTVAQNELERENLLQHLQNQEQLHSELKDRLSQIHIESVELRKEREKVSLELQRAERDCQVGEVEIEKLNLQLEELAGKIADWVEKISAGDREDARLVDQISAADEAIRLVSEGLDVLVAEIQQTRIEASRQQEKRVSLQYRIDRLRLDIEDNERRSESLKVQREREERELAQIADGKAQVESQRQETTAELNTAMAKLAEIKDRFNETCTRLLDLRSARSETQKRRDDIVAEFQDTELKAAQETASLDQIRGIAMERYQKDASPLDEAATIDIEQLPLFSSSLEVGWNELNDRDRETLLREHLNSLKEKITRYGEVNLTAIQEFDEIQKRYDFLMEQKTDLEKSISILEEAIVKIDESSKQRFEETFEAVNLKFREIFPILFGGGKAELTLLPAENVLDAGVDITVHPPGKRPASITLLSGGEKALTAVSLILAIFARKPSPFCLLDEVDAPLDDANVSRFNTVVRKMAEKTQFILITHNKKTMECAEALYGVTMEKAGISRMTSVRLN